MISRAADTKSPRPGWKRWFIRTGLVLLTSTALGFTVLFFVSRSTILKLLPAPETEKIVLSGKAASGMVIDAGGGWYNDGKLTELVIRSKKTADGWERPEGIIIRNCRIRGSIRIMGMGRNGEATEVKKSSHTEGHIQRAQSAAPTGILISGVEIEAAHGIPLYLAPGVTKVTVEESKFTGWSVATGLYLDAESADNVIRNNTFTLKTGREVIAIDGSAGNHLEGNRFQNPAFGGIYVYRNCGEGGTVRHQMPQGNVILDNHFATGMLGVLSYGIWLGSRNGHRSYCEDDAGYPFGSSADNRDFADNNSLSGNIFDPPTPRSIRDDGRGN